MTPDQAKTLTDTIARFVESQPDLKSLALVGSWARNAARPDSDIDLLVLADDPSAYRTDRTWLIRALAPQFRVSSSHVADYGQVWSCHAQLEPTCELELSFGPLAWTATNPIDAGTMRVARDGLRIIVDKDDRLRRLVDAVDSLPAT